MCAVCCITSLYCNLNSKGYFVADEAMSDKKKKKKKKKKNSCLVTYTVERKNNVFKTLSEQSKLEKAEASLKNTERKD